MIKLADMMAYDSERDIFNFPLAINLHGEERWLMVQADVFTGGKFYIVRGKGIAPLHILCIFEDERKKGKLHFTVMNDDTSCEDLVAAVMYALRQSLDNDDLPGDEMPGDLPFE